MFHSDEPQQMRRELAVHDVERMALFFGDEGLGMGLRYMNPNGALLETSEVMLSLVKHDPTRGAIG